MNRYIDKITILLILVVSFWVSSNLSWGGGKPQTIIKADGKAYYAHLPALFIYHDVNFGFFDEYEAGKYYNKNLYYNYVKEYNNRRYTKYFCGTAVPMAPFFGMAHGLSYAFGLPTDGYANLYHIFINIAAIFYLAVALLFFGKLLDRFHVSAINKALTYLIIYFGTNWFYWVNVEPAVSHVYSVAFIPMFYYYYVKFSETYKTKHLVITALLLGLVILIRPINAMCVIALPIFFSTFKSFADSVLGILSKPKYAAIAILGVVGVASLQLLLYKAQVGQFFIYAYEEEGLDLLKPNLADFLLSYKKGLFVYTPVLLASLIGFVFWFKDYKVQSIVGVLALFVIIYILGSWHMWWYGGGFGTRVMLEYYILWSIPLAYLLNNVTGVKRKISISVLTVLVLFCQFQTFQYRYYLIHWDGITKEEYWNVFLKPWF